MIKLLLIEDDANLGYIIKSSLEEIVGGYDVSVATNGMEGLAMLSRITPDIIVSDIDMPVLDGVEMVKKIRMTDNNIPVIFASGKVSSKDVTTGYAVGADNYIKKPFLPEELDAHIKALIKLKSPAKKKDGKFRIGQYIFDAAHYCIEYNLEKQRLSLREVELLTLLCENMGEVVHRDEVLTKYWGNNDYFTSRSLDVFISKIRAYLAKDPSVSITNIKGVGFILEVTK